MTNNDFSTHSLFYLGRTMQTAMDKAAMLPSTSTIANTSDTATVTLLSVKAFLETIHWRV